MHVVFGPDMVSRHFEREQESIQTSWQTPLTSDCLDTANDIIAEEDSFQKYFQLRFYNGTNFSFNLVFFDLINFFARRYSY
jgi:hypothetical protein